MGVGEDDRRWTIRVCEPCGELVTWCRCEWLPRQPEPPSVDVDVVPASVVVGLRGEVERLRAERAEIIAALRSAKYGVEGVHEIDGYDGAPTVAGCVRYLAEQRELACDADDELEVRVRELEDALLLERCRIARAIDTEATEREPYDEWSRAARGGWYGAAGFARSLPAPAVLASSSESPVDTVARIGQDVQPDGYATHTTCSECGGDGSAGAAFDGNCPAAPYHGRVPVVSLEQEDNR